MIKVSVILPVYGVSEYIEKCTRSLLAQSLEEMEFLFVDDHGPDDSIEVVRRTIAGHPREAQFRFLDPGKNLGPGLARNYAIPYAQGTYVAFVDSDDWVEPDMFETLYRQAESHGMTDLSYGHAFKDFEDGKPSSVLRNPLVPSGCLTHEHRAHFLVNYVSYFWTFIYKKEFLCREEICFPEERWSEDSYFVSCCLLTAQSIASVDKPLYHYIVRPGSASTTPNSTKYRQRIAVFNKLLQFAKDRHAYDDFKEEIDFMFAKKCGLMSLVDYIKDSSNPDPSQYKTIHQEVFSYIPDYQRNKYYKENKKVRLLLWLSQHLPGFFTRVVRRFS